MSIPSERPRFSVVVPTHNRGSALLGTLATLLASPFDSFEVVVVDDGSTDDTQAVLRSISDPRLRVVRRDNGGISAARNTGVEAAHGEYVLPLDDDDVPASSWLAEFDAEIAASAAAVVTCGCTVVDATTGTTLETMLPYPLGPVFSNYVGLFMAGTFAVRRDVYLSVGGFTEGLQCSHQTEFSIRLLAMCRDMGLKVSHLDHPLLAIRRRRASDRPESSPAKLLEGMTVILALHREQLELDPQCLANYLAIAGVNAYKLGRVLEARQFLRTAVRTQPRSPLNYSRLLLTYAPPLAARVWAQR